MTSQPLDIRGWDGTTSQERASISNLLISDLLRTPESLLVEGLWIIAGAIGVENAFGFHSSPPVQLRFLPSCHLLVDSVAT